MKFVVFIGVSDPYHNDYKVICDLIKNEAKNKDFDEVLLPSYPGHQSYTPRVNEYLKRGLSGS